MRAMLVDHAEPGHLKLSEIPDPVPLSNQCVVQVKAISLNLGEVKRARRSEPGTLLGWDIAGVVAEAAPDGTGPAPGTRVVGYVNGGAWAERVAIGTDQLAVLPDDVTFARAATLPVAGLTALYALEQGGQLLGRRVLVTGASGGVGIFGIQLAKLQGAVVTALVRRERNASIVRDVGADHVVVGERAEAAAAHGKFHCVLESVGGPVLADALKLMARGGVLVSYGISAGEPAKVDAGEFFRVGRARYYGLYLFTEFGRRPAWDGLDVLVGLVSNGSLAIHIDAEDEFAGLGRMAERLFNREITGKAVLHVGT